MSGGQDFDPDLDDAVEHPRHYQVAKGVESIDIIKAVLTPEEFAGFCKGNIIKYSHRAHKKNGLEDWKKANKYLRWFLERQ